MKKKEQGTDSNQNNVAAAQESLVIDKKRFDILFVYCCWLFYLYGL